MVIQYALVGCMRLQLWTSIIYQSVPRGYQYRFAINLVSYKRYPSYILSNHKQSSFCHLIFFPINHTGRGFLNVFFLMQRVVITASTRLLKNQMKVDSLTLILFCALLKSRCNLEIAIIKNSLVAAPADLSIRLTAQLGVILTQKYMERLLLADRDLDFTYVCASY